VLLRVLVFAVALSLVLLKGWLLHRLLSPEVTNRAGVPSEQQEEGTNA
jgi:hypothetical protein